MKLPTWAYTVACALALTSCGQAASDAAGGKAHTNSAGTDGGSADSAGGGSTNQSTSLTYYKDTKPIIDTMCTACHSTGNIAPFTLTSYADVQSHLADIGSAVGNNVMPPWPPGPNCNTYKYDTALSADQKSKLTNWMNGGAPAGDPTDAISSSPLVVGTMPRVDATIKMPQPYQIHETPDEYRCFVLDWPATTTKYITGFRVHPDNTGIVHHAIAIIADPDQVSAVMAKDGADGKGPGYDCYGEFGANSILPHWLGFWAPGNNGAVFSDDERTGLPIVAGSKIVLQMHYHWEGDPNKAGLDQSAMDIMWKDSVPKPGAVVQLLGLQWYLDPTSMVIPADDADAQVSASLSMSTIWSLFSDKSPTASKYLIYGVGLHMHVRGLKGNISLTPSASKADQCLLDVPQ